MQLHVSINEVACKLPNREDTDGVRRPPFKARRERGSVLPISVLEFTKKKSPRSGRVIDVTSMSHRCHVDESSMSRYTYCAAVWTATAKSFGFGCCTGEEEVEAVEGEVDAGESPAAAAAAAAYWYRSRYAIGNMPLRTCDVIGIWHTSTEYYESY